MSSEEEEVDDFEVTDYEIASALGVVKARNLKALCISIYSLHATVIRYRSFNFQLAYRGDWVIFSAQEI